MKTSPKKIKEFEEKLDKTIEELIEKFRKKLEESKVSKEYKETAIRMLEIEKGVLKSLIVLGIDLAYKVLDTRIYKSSYIMSLENLSDEELYIIKVLASSTYLEPDTKIWIHKNSIVFRKFLHSDDNIFIELVIDCYYSEYDKKFYVSLEIVNAFVREFNIVSEDNYDERIIIELEFSKDELDFGERVYVYKDFEGMRLWIVAIKDKEILYKHYEVEVKHGIREIRFRESKHSHIAPMSYLCSVYIEYKPKKFSKDEILKLFGKEQGKEILKHMLKFAL